MHDFCLNTVGVKVWSFLTALSSCSHYCSQSLTNRFKATKENGEGVLDKDATSQDDLFYSFRMSLQFWLDGPTLR